VKWARTSVEGIPPAHYNPHWAVTVELRWSWTSYGGAVEEPRNNIMWALQLISSNEYRAIRVNTQTACHGTHGPKLG
jgi:hypothetical protein